MKLKKLLSLMLCIAMVLSTMGLNVFAEGETVHTVSNDTELADAIQNAVDGDTIKLAAGNYTGGISIGKNIIFEGSVDEDGNPTTVFSSGNPAIKISKGTVKNIKIADAFRGFYGEPCGDCVFDNVYMIGVTYGFHLVAYSNDPQWAITNCYVDASWANSFGAYQCDGATIVVRNNEFVSTTPYYDNGSGAPLVNTYSPKTIIEDNIFGANAKISIREEAKDGVKIGTNYYEDGFENALYEDCADGVKIETYYADREMTEVVEVFEDTSSLPNAIVESLGAITINKYKDYGNGGLNGAECTDPIELPVAMEFVAKDTVEEAEKNAYADYITDFFIKIEGLENGSFIADDCYLAGHYGDWGWYKIPIDGLEVQNGVIYPVITSVGANFTYAGICEWIKKFTCGMYLSDKVLDENPDIKVTLSLGLSETLEKAQAGDFILVDKAYTYNYYDFKGTAEEIECVTATDEGYYEVNGERSGLIRFLFGFDTEEENIKTGIRFIKSGDITAQVGETMQGKSKAFHADITGIPENSENTYYAIAFLKVNPDTENEKVYWSDVASCTPNFEKFFGTKGQ